jgi:hypothetical protein
VNAERGRPILVTGAHRSGTTWVGRMLALAPAVGYLHEPFSPATSPGINGAAFPRYYERVTEANEELYAPHLERALAFRYDLPRALAALRTPADAARSARDAARFVRARRAGARPLVKDPIALRSADWLADRFGMEVVVTIRHPAAFAASAIRLGYAPDLAVFLGDERLQAFEPELRRQLAKPGEALEQAALVWRLLYTLVDGYRRSRPEWLFVRHEDASRAPLETFESLYGRLGLDWTERARRGVARASSTANPPETASKHAVRVDSAANVGRWRARLPEADAARLREATGDVWPRFYADEDW